MKCRFLPADLCCWCGLLLLNTTLIAAVSIAGPLSSPWQQPWCTSFEHFLESCLLQFSEYFLTHCLACQTPLYTTVALSLSIYTNKTACCSTAGWSLGPLAGWSHSAWHGVTTATRVARDQWASTAAELWQGELRNSSICFALPSLRHFPTAWELTFKDGNLGVTTSSNMAFQYVRSTLSGTYIIMYI